MFREPPLSRYDLNFSIFGFDVRVHPFFWVMCLILGFSPDGLERIGTWTVLVFISILIHELGHSFMMRRFGIDSHIVLHSFGGLAISRSARRSQLDWIRQIMISLAGPFAGFLFGGLVLGIVYASGGIVYLTKVFDFLPIPVAFTLVSGRGGEMLNDAIWIIIWINTFWGLINLLPVFPLDGGQVAMHLFIRFDPWNGGRNALWLSVLTGVALAIGGYILLDSFFMAFMFGMLALQSYQMIQGGVGPRF